MRALLFLALAVTSSYALNNSYVVISPSKIRANMDLSLSVNILQAAGDVTVTASINRGSTLVVSSKGVFQAGVPGSITLKTPESLPNAGYTLKVEGAGGLTFNQSTDLTFNKKEISLFIQSDKAIYKPGDTVNFRGFAVYSDLKSYTGLMDISVFDADANKIKQWLQVKPTDGVISQQITLSSQPVLGDWRIHIDAGDYNVEKVFTVAEYVLPKFEVDVVMPSYALTTDSDITFTIKAKYTYGKPVKGTADVSVQLLYSSDVSDASKAHPVTTVSKVTIDGEGKVTIPMSFVKKVNDKLNGHTLIVTANVSESLTGNTMSGNGTVKLYDNGVTLEFPKTNPTTFKPSLKYTAYLKVSQPDGLPVSASTQKITVEPTVVIELPEDKNTTHPFYYEPPTETKKLAAVLFDVPTNGLVAIPIDLPMDAKSATFTATFQGVTASLTLGKSHSPSNSYVQLFLESSSSIQAGDSIAFRVKATQPLTNLIYQVMSRGGIVKTGSIKVNNVAEQTFAVASDSSMAPNARIVVYYVRGDGEIVTDSISFDISGAFKNKVSINLNTTDAEPGDTVKVTVQADPSSTAHLMAIDQSVLLLKSGNDVTADDVYSELKAYDTIDSVSHNRFPFFDCPNCKRRKRFIWWPFPIFYGGNDATQIFDNAGVKVLTDALLYHYQEPIRRWPIYYMMMDGVRPPVLSHGTGQNVQTDTGDSLKEPTRTRSNFVETFLWNDVFIGADGKASVSAQIPDTITSWVASAFAINSVTGLGVSPSQAHLKVFRPFFVSLNLPYSVTRGEQLALQAIVFNYMDEEMQVRVTLAKSTSFFNIVVNGKGQEDLKQEDEIQDIVVAAGEAKSVYFPIVPSGLGRINVEVKAQSTKAADAVRRQLLVEAEGVPKEYNIPMLIDLTDGKTSFSELALLTLPANTVKGSELVRITAVGDMMGPTISGLDSLLQMPTGCGEQTMLGLAPDVYVTDYLKAVNQLNGDVKTKALGYMESGYQRELTYKHKDNSFSAFGDSDSSGSMWLTAFVTRVFHQAKAHIFVDEGVIIASLKWMVGKQNQDGSFPEPGNVIHKNMQGNSANGTALTLFVLTSLLENKDLLTNTDASGVKLDQATSKALAFAEKAVAQSDDLYVLALASYAFQLAGSAQTPIVLERLEKRASVKDGSKYWHEPESAKTNTESWESPNPTQAIDTEMTSYVLLAYVARGELVKAKNIIPWITKQRNPHGGFQSTQDTVVALFAMTQFARQVYSNNYNVHVTATTSPTDTFTFNIDQTNSLLLQSKELTVVPSQVKVDATGSGMALVDVAVFFNVESEIEEIKFELKVTLIEETINHLAVETCTKWLGSGPSSGMAVQEIGIPSGFDVDLESITQLTILKRVETQNKKVILYFDQIGTTPVCLNFVAERTGLVAKSQPAAVRVYDYYAPHNQVTAFYQSQILKDSSICDVCKDCDKCAV